MVHRTHVAGQYHPTFMGNVPVRGAMILAQTRSNKITKPSLHQIARAVWSDIRTTNRSLAGKGANKIGGALISSNITNYYEALSPAKWALKGFGPLPYEFTASGAIQWTELTFGARLLRVGISAGVSSALTFVAFEGGVLIGASINQALPESVKDDIGGTINEVINEGGYKELWQHPFGIGM